MIGPWNRPRQMRSRATREINIELSIWRFFVRLTSRCGFSFLDLLSGVEEPVMLMDLGRMGPSLAD
jgi:hypothetical protein